MKKHFHFIIALILITGCGSVTTYQQLSRESGKTIATNLPRDAALSQASEALKERGFSVTDKGGGILWARKPRSLMSYAVNVVVKVQPKGNNQSEVTVSGDSASLFLSADGVVESVLEKLRTRQPEQLVTKPTQRFPPILSARVSFLEPSGNRYLDAEETGRIKVAVSNSGKGTASNVQIKLTPATGAKNLTYKSVTSISRIPSGETKTVEVPISAAESVASQLVRINVEVLEGGMGADADPVALSFNTRELLPPKLEVVQYAVDDDQGESQGNNNGTIEPGELVEITAIIQNKGAGDSLNVSVTPQITVPNAFYQSEKTTFELGKIVSGSWEKVTFSVFVNKRFTGDAVPVTLKITEQRPRFNVSQEISLDVSRPDRKPEEVAVSPDETSAGGSDASPGRIAPQLILVSPSGNQIEVNADTLNLTVVATDDRGIREVEITVNGNPLLGRGFRRQNAEPQTSITIKESIALSYGENKIKLVAFDTDYQSSEPVVISVTRTRELSELWILSIGISDYLRVNKLNYADDDAVAVADYFRDIGVPADHIDLLVDEEATVGAVRRAFGKLMSRAKKAASVVIYFSGHGAPAPNQASLDGDGIDKYLLTYEADPDNLYGTALPMDEIAGIFSRLASDRVVFIADTCYSGAAGGKTVLAKNIKAAPNYDQFLSRMAEGEGRVILTASRGSEVSQESPKYKHGFFTYFLLEALRGSGDRNGDGFITFNEVCDYVNREVPKHVNQTPTWKGESSGDLVLGRKIETESDH